MFAEFNRIYALKINLKNLETIFLTQKLYMQRCVTYEDKLAEMSKMIISVLKKQKSIK